MREKLQQMLARNFALRVIALALAIALWLFVNTGQHPSQETLTVPVTYRRLPQGLVITNQRPDFISLEVSGPRTLLSLLDPGRLELRLDLTDVTPGQASFRIGPEMFNVPRQTTVTRIVPSQIVLDIDKIVKREIPVHLDISGQAANGFRISEVELKPPGVAVSGPSHDLSHLDRIDTEPFDIKDDSDPIDRMVPLVIPPGPVKLHTTEVEARVSFAEIMGDREFRTVPVKVRDPDYKYRLLTREVTVTVHGPVRKLSGLSLEGMVYVDAHGEAPGIHELPVQVQLPDGLQVVRQMPDKVRLRIFGEKVDTKD